MKATFKVKVEVEFVKNLARKDDPNAPFDGCLFESGLELKNQYGRDVFNSDYPGIIFTIIEGDDNEMYLVKGFHVCNVVGYLITFDDIDFEPLNVKELE